MLGDKFKIAMFITSYIPLWITIIIMNVLSIIRNKDSSYIEIASTVVIVFVNIIAILVINISLKSIENYEYRKYKIIEVKQEKGFTSEYTISYVLSLLAFDFSELESIIKFLIFFITLGFLCCRNDNVYSNIILELKKYKFYDCELMLKFEYEINSIRCMVISKNDLLAQRGNSIEIKPLNQPFYLMKDLEE